MSEQSKARTTSPPSTPTTRPGRRHAAHQRRREHHLATRTTRSDEQTEVTTPRRHRPPRDRIRRRRQRHLRPRNGDAFGTTHSTTTSATFDGEGDQLSSTDAEGNSTTFAYDPTGTVTQEVQPVSSASGTIRRLKD